jgi:dimethylaniline monooxygenase (N-oxide forming)
MGLRVGVIGAGPLGLTAMKNLKEDGFDVTGFESRSYVGGLWRYNNDKAISVLESTALNSSRIRSSITDFPFPEEDDDFPTWQQVDKYLNSYADYFGLRETIHLNSFIRSVERDGDKWVLEIVHDGTSRHERFDKILVATGTFNKPKMPHFEGIECFKGQQLHAVDFHEPEKFNGKNVVLVGLHASSHDVALCLSGHAKQLYLSHRNGVVMVSGYPS